MQCKQCDEKAVIYHEKDPLCPWCYATLFNIALRQQKPKLQSSNNSCKSIDKGYKS